MGCGHGHGEGLGMGRGCSEVLLHSKVFHVCMYVHSPCRCILFQSTSLAYLP